MLALCPRLLPAAALLLVLTLPRSPTHVELEPARMATSAGRGGLPRVLVTHHSGAQLEVYLHGATITSFCTPAGQELLFTSTEAVFDGLKPIRGGIPIAFPQFASQGPLPQHGFVRTAQWAADEVGDGVVALSLSDSDATRAVWPHAFKLVLRAQFDAGRLATHLEVANPKAAPGPFAFEALQHSYFYAGPGDDAAARLRLAGLGGVTYHSKPHGGAPFVQPTDGDAGGFGLEGEVDRIYCDTRADVVVTGVTSGAGLPATAAAPVFTSFTVRRRAALRQAAPALSQIVEACPLDVVVWNAGPERAKAIADLGDDDWRHYVCVEPGRVSPATAAHHAGAALQPGQAYTLTQEVLLHY